MPTIFHPRLEKNQQGTLSEGKNDLSTKIITVGNSLPDYILHQTIFLKQMLVESHIFITLKCALIGVGVSNVCLDVTSISSHSFEVRGLRFGIYRHHF